MSITNNILPVIDKPPITVYRNYSYPLCIICADKLGNDWLYNHFSNIYLMRNKNNYIWLDFLEPNNGFGALLDYEYIKLDDINNFDIKTLIKDTINDNKYVTLFLDGYYLNNTAITGKKHSISEYFIYGYNDEKETFYAVGFNSLEFFGKLTYSYDEVIKAHNSLIHDREKFGELPVWVLWYAFSKIKKKNNGAEQVNTDNLIKNIEEYASATVMKDKLRTEIIEGRGESAVYGANCQKEIIKSLYAMMDNGDYFTDYRHIHLLYEHKKILFAKMKYIAIEKNLDVSEIIDRYKLVMKKIELAKIFYLKAIISEPDAFLYDKLKDTHMISKIIHFLEDVLDIESEVLRDYLTAIKAVIV